MNSQFRKGLLHGIPIALGYLSVSFGFGIMAVQKGLSVLEAVMISVTNLTSAGQAAGVEIIAAAGTLFEMVLTQLIINIRYSLMGISLSQKLDKSFTTPHRLAVSFGITDEIFAVSSAQIHPVTPAYMYGLILISFLGWGTGTLLGAAAGEILPVMITEAMGIVLYGMFIAIIIPVAKRSKPVLGATLVASLISIIFTFVPMFKSISSGFVIIISAVVASGFFAYFFPIKEEEARNE
jgi:4-azaleucine resistance transporter AzlC